MYIHMNDFQQTAWKPVFHCSTQICSSFVACYRCYSTQQCIL